MFYLLMRHAENSADAVMSHLGEHLEWMRSKQQSGDILMAGPTRDFKTSIYVIRAHSLEDAQRLGEEDPIFKAVPESTIKIYEWDVHHILGVGVFTVGGGPVATRDRRSE